MKKFVVYGITKNNNHKVMGQITGRNYKDANIKLQKKRSILYTKGSKYPNYYLDSSIYYSIENAKNLYKGTGYIPKKKFVVARSNPIKDVVIPTKQFNNLIEAREYIKKKKGINYFENL